MFFCICKWEINLPAYHMKSGTQSNVVDGEKPDYHSPKLSRKIWLHSNLGHAPTYTLNDFEYMPPYSHTKI